MLRVSNIMNPVVWLELLVWEMHFLSDFHIYLIIIMYNTCKVQRDGR